MRKKVLLLDVDGVLFNFDKPFIRYLKSEGYVPEELGPNYAVDWDFSYHLGDKKKNIPKYIGDFVTTQDWRHLPPLARTLVLEELKNLGVSIHCLTQVTSPVARGIRVTSLTEVFGPVFDGIHFTQHKESKFDMIKSIVGDSTLIGFLEDKPTTLVEGYQKGYPMYAVEHAYNQDVSNYPIPFGTTDEILEVLKDDILTGAFD